MSKGPVITNKFSEEAHPSTKLIMMQDLKNDNISIKASSRTNPWTSDIVKSDVLVGVQSGKRIIPSIVIQLSDNGAHVSSFKTVED